MQFESNPSRAQRFRFQAISDVVDSPIVMKDLLNLLHVCTSSTNSSRIIMAARVVSVEAWGIDDGKSLAGQDPLTLTWSVGSTAYGGPGSSINVFGNAFQPAHFKCAPPANSLCGAWFTNLTGANGAFNISCGSGTVLDVTLEWVLYDSTAVGVAPLASAASTAGTLYQNYLDNSAPGSASSGPLNWLPMGPRATLAAWS